MPCVTLVPPTLDDRSRVYGWMTTPGIVERMMGPPDFPDNEVPDYDEFIEDWLPHYWTHAEPERGRLFLIVHESEEVGMVAHNDVVSTAAGERATELDLWLRGPADTGRGLGPAAIEALVAKLTELGVELVFIQPSGRNRAAIRSYEKAGFERVSMDVDAAEAYYGTEADYADSTFLAMRLRP